jgi:release factor glutamine methyltransferase
MFYYFSGKELSDWRLNAKKQAIAFNIPSEEVDLLLQELTNLDRLALRLNSFENQATIESQKTLIELKNLWQLRLQKRIPLQYLIGKCHWRNFTLKVSPDVLIPRPETELIIDLVQEGIKNSPNSNLSLGHWVDLGTGSGAIAIGLAESLTNATIHAIDISEKALNIAQENAINLGYKKNINFYPGSWFSPLINFPNKMSGIISNPPYIPSNLIPHLQEEVTKHEPHLALDGGDDGLNYICYLVKKSPFYLVSGGVFLIEIMAGQAKTVERILKEQGDYTNIKICQDLAGIERFILGFRC